ncbi:uncharacterized protein MONBRDRAFT_36925, partial [Monosiga brevicollis MX1]
MMGDSAVASTWEKAPSVMGLGSAQSAPFVVFTKDLSTSVVVSSFSNFMVHTTHAVPDALEFGVLGTVEEIPEGFALETIVKVGSGINQATMAWGDDLLAYYGRDRYQYRSDYTLSMLGYSTDNGAYYYYQTENNKTYEDTLLDVYDYAQQESIPYRYILLDSWWYYKGPHNGVTVWDAMPSIFPHGLEYFFNKTGWYQQLHNRYWSAETPYAKQNGGEYDFLIDESSQYAVPTEQAFWDQLMLDKRRSGMINYEQDWLDDEYD